MWWSGPEWLLDDRDKWPKMELDNPPNSLPERKTANKRNEYDQSAAVKTCHHQRPVLEGKEITETENTDWRLDPRRYPSWIHLVRVHARVQRVVNNMRKAEKRVGRELSPEEDETQKKILFAQHNKRSFRRNKKP